MRFLKRIAGFLGFAKDELHENKEDEDDVNPNNSDDIRRNRMNVDPIHAGPRKGFSVPVQVPVERPVVGPILVPCNGDGGVQVLFDALAVRMEGNGHLGHSTWFENAVSVMIAGMVAESQERLRCVDRGPCHGCRDANLI
ncbi:Cyclic di-GMP-binding protein [Bienertia sinuspersici]